MPTDEERARAFASEWSDRPCTKEEWVRRCVDHFATIRREALAEAEAVCRDQAARDSWEKAPALSATRAADRIAALGRK